MSLARPHPGTRSARAAATPATRLVWRLRRLVPGVAVLVLIAALHTLTLAAGVSAELPVSTAVVETAAGRRHEFRVFLALTHEHRRRGLMHVTELAPDEGMLFDLQVPQFASFWMKNTPLSLDIVFVREDGRISNIAADTEPYSHERIPSHGDVLAVLELNAGTCRRLGIEPGDVVVHEILGNTPR